MVIIKVNNECSTLLDQNFETKIRMNTILKNLIYFQK